MKQVRSRGARLASLTFLGLAGAGAPALAQESQPPASGAAASDTITVTAQRREEDIQDVPVTVTVVSQDQLNIQNIQTTTDLTRALPALTATDQGVYQVRGIGTKGFGRSAEQSVSVVMDGVVLGRALTNSLYDVDHVELLSGPQGTLFGKNANAGVLNVVTRAPQLNEYGFAFHADIGAEHDYVHSYVIGNIPLGDTAALRISYHHDSTGEIAFNTFFNEWDYNTDDGVRARLLWEPTNRLTVNLSADYQKLESNGVNGVSDFAGVQIYSFVRSGSVLQQTLAGCGIVASSENNRVCGNSLRDPNAPNLGDTYGRKNYGGSVQLDYELDSGATITSISAIRATDTSEFGLDANLAGFFGDTLPQNLLDRNMVPFEADSWSQELRIATPLTNPVSFVAGLYASGADTHDEIDQSGTFGIPLGGLQFRRFINFHIDQRSYAGFGQVDWRVQPNLKLFAGARVTRDELQDFSYNSFPRAFPAGPYLYTGNTGFFSVLPVNSCTIAGGVPFAEAGVIVIPCPAGTSLNEPGELEETGVSGTLGAQYNIDDDTMVFARLARGYKGPFINESVTYTASLSPNQPLVVDSEYANSFELGVKTKFDRFNVNATLFASRIDDYQTTIFVPPVPPQIVANFIQGNAPFAITQGVEVTFFGELFDNFNLNGGFLYNEARYNEGFTVNCGTPCLAVDQLPFAPRWKATMAGDYHVRVADGLDGFAQFDFSYSDFFYYGSSPGSPKSPPRYLLGVRGGVRGADGRWGLSLFCRNCLDERYPVVETFDGFAAFDGANVAAPGMTLGPGVTTQQFLSIDSYRVVGVTVDFNF